MQSDPQVATVTDLLKRSQNSLFGKYKAIVKHNDDPQRKGRLKLEIPSVFGTTITDWVIGAFPFGGNMDEAMVCIPAVGSNILVEFIEGDKSSPVWTATYYPANATEETKGTMPEGFDLDQGGLHYIRTAQGIEIRLEDNRKPEDDGGEQQVVINHPKGTSIVINATGAVKITDSETAEVLLDPENKITRIKGHGSGLLEMVDGSLTLEHGDSSLKLDGSSAVVSAASIKLEGDSVSLGKGANSPIMNAQAFITAYSAHVHPCPTGSTTPPAPPDPTLVQAASLTKVTGA